VAGGVPVWLVATFVTLLGLAFGSFLNVCISRLPGHESIVRPGSRCPRCSAPVRARDNVPLLSWFALHGRCRQCGWRIPWRYPAVEAATAAAFVLCFLRFGPSVYGIGMSVLCFLLLGLAVTDAETMRLPDAFTLPGIGLGIAYSGLLFGITGQTPGAFLLPGSRSSDMLYRGAFLGTARWSPAATAMVASAIWALLAAVVILTIRWLYFLARHKVGMGIGDAKLLAMIAAWLGPALTLLTLFLGVVGAAIAGLIWLEISHIWQRRGDGGRPGLALRLPFGSFLCAAAIYAIFAGEPLVRWYLKFFP
jgi:leader peptidase (prepilin peptidase)/N-methyltransferase